MVIWVNPWHGRVWVGRKRILKYFNQSNSGIDRLFQGGNDYKALKKCIRTLPLPRTVDVPPEAQGFSRNNRYSV